jgi:chromate transporter
LIKGIFSGLRPVVVGLIASAAMLLMNGENFGYETYNVVWSIIICIASFSIVYFTKIHPILVICIAGIAGLLIF